MIIGPVELVLTEGICISLDLHVRVVISYFYLPVRSSIQLNFVTHSLYDGSLSRSIV